jgi:hypothetical protein
MAGKGVAGAADGASPGTTTVTTTVSITFCGSPDGAGLPQETNSTAMTNTLSTANNLRIAAPPMVYLWWLSKTQFNVQDTQTYRASAPPLLLWGLTNCSGSNVRLHYKETKNQCQRI